MTESSSFLQRRSDGWYETAEGAFAVTMVVRTGQRGNLRWFQYKTSHASSSVRIEWNADDRLQVFPQEVASYLLAQGFARQPTEAALAWYAHLVGYQPVPAPAEPAQEAPKPAPEGGAASAPAPVPAPAEPAPPAAPMAPPPKKTKGEALPPPPVVSKPEGEAG